MRPVGRTPPGVPDGGPRASVTNRGRSTLGRGREMKTGHHGECLQVATAEPTRADDTDPGPGTGPRIREPAEPETGNGKPPTGLRARIWTALLALRERLLRHPVLSMTALSGVLHVVWFFTFANSGGDLAAQDAWAEFVGRHPDSAYNLAWYGGMHPVSYSIVSPYLMHVLGVRTTMMVAGTRSCALLALILTRTHAIRNPLPPALAGAFASPCNAVSGRVTFGLGTMFALGAVALVFSWPGDPSGRSRPWMYGRAGAAALLA